VGLWSHAPRYHFARLLDPLLPQFGLHPIPGQPPAVPIRPCRCFRRQLLAVQLELMCVVYFETKFDRFWRLQGLPSMKSLSCPNRQCPPSKMSVGETIIRHGFYKTRWGNRRRYYCQACGKTFRSTIGTPYYRLHHRRATFDRVASLSVEGLSKSAIARVKQIGWNTVHRWLERAAASCRGFSNRKIKGLAIAELQADEIRTIVGAKERQVWVFVVIDVWSRLWPSTIVGKRSYQSKHVDTVSRSV
jgi:transposase-like protein